LYYRGDEPLGRLFLERVLKIIFYIFSSLFVMSAIMAI
jgi:hypothetical protein